MKKIMVFQENVDKIELLDSDESSLSDYVQKLSSLLKLSDISILHTSSGSVILRPSKVVSFLVSEVKAEVEEIAEQIESPESVDHVDIITDGG